MKISTLRLPVAVSFAFKSLYKKLPEAFGVRMLMMVVLCLGVGRGWGQLLQQDFSSSTTVSNYVNAAPTNGQFNAISTSGAGTVLSINTTGSNKLRFARTANAGAFSRTTDFSPTPTSLIYRFDLTVSGNSAAVTSLAAWQIGSGFGTGNATEANAAVHSRIGLNWTTTAGQFSIRDIGAGTNSANYTGTQTITWVINNSGGILTYKAPDGSYETVGDDRADIWISTTKELNEIIATTASQTLTDLKFAITGGVGNVDIDNILIDPVPGIPTSNAASVITSSSFQANWTTLTGVTGYRVDVATDAGFTNFVSGYNNLYVSGQATNSLSVTGLSASTPYWYRVRAASQYTVGEFASGNSASQNPTTTSGCSSPATQPSSFSSNTIIGTSANIAFTRGDGDNVLVIGRAGSAVATNPASGTAYGTNNATNQVFGSGDAIGSGFVVYNGAAAGASTATGDIALSNLANGTTYHFAAYEYNNTGNCYNLVSPLTGNLLTIPAAPTANAASSVATTSFTANWSTVSGATGYRLDVATDNAFTSILAGYNNLAVAGTSQSVTGLIANTPYYYRVRAENGTGVSANSGIINPTTLLAATKLALVGVPATGSVNTPLSSFTVEAQRPDNSVDNSFTGSITISKASGSGAISGTLSVSAVAGIATFSTVQFDAADTYTITASSGVLTNATSGNIVITPVSSTSDYFRSVATGNWNAISTWESSPDNISWIPASLTPTDLANTITIISGHTVTASASVTADQLVINSGGQVTVSVGQTLTIANGAGTDLSVAGTLLNSGTVALQGATSTIVAGTFTNSGSLTLATVTTSLTVNGIFTQTVGTAITNASNGPISFAANSQYNHQANGGTIPTASWNATSTCTVTGMLASGPSGLGQTFGNFVWNNTSQSTFFNINNSSFATTGKLTVASTNASNLALVGSTTSDFSNSFGTLEVTGGTFNLNFVSTAGGGTSTVTVAGDVTVSNSALLNISAGTGNPASASYMTQLNIGGNLSVAANAAFTATNATGANNYGYVVFNKAGTQTANIVSGGTGARGKFDCDVNLGSTLQLLSNFPMSSRSTSDYDIFTAIGTVDFGTFSIVQGAAGTAARFTSTSGALLKTANTSGIFASIAVGGTKVFNSGTNYEFNASTATAFPTAVQQASFGNPSNITVNADITLNRDITVSGILDLTNKIVTNTGNTLTISGTISRTTGTIAGTGTTVFVGPSSIVSGLFASNIVTGGLTINRAGGVSLASDLTVNGALTFTSGKLVIGANTLTLAGTTTGGSAANSLTGGSSSNLAVTGTGALGTLFFDQTTDGATNTLNSITVNRTSSGSVTLGNKLVILDNYTPTAGALNTGGFLNLRSTATKTARIASNTSGVDYINGNVTVERYIPSRRAWKLLTAPVRNAGSVWTNWQNAGTPNGATGVNIWGPTGTNPVPAANGLNLGPNYSMKSYAPATNSWASVTNTTTSTLSTNAGSNNGGAADNKSFLVFVTNPFDNLGTNILASSGSAVTTLRATGSLQQGDQTFSIGANSGTNQYALVGNPYASPVDFSQLMGAAGNQTAIEKRFWLFDATQATLGGYQLVFESAGLYYIVPGTTPSGSTPAGEYVNLQSGQAVFVEPTATGGTLTFQEAHKSSLVTPPPIFLVPPQSLAVNLNQGNQLLDGALMLYDNNYTTAIATAEDVKKIYNDGPNVAIARDNNGYIVEARPEITIKDTSFLWISNLQLNQSYNFSFKAERFNPVMTAWLEDAFTNSRTPINLSGALNTINFSTTSDPASRHFARFRIVYQSAAGPLPISFTNVKASKQNTAVKVDWTVSGELNADHYEVEYSTNGTDFNLLAKVAATGNNNSTVNYSYLHATPVTGMNYYRIKLIEVSGNIKYSLIVKADLSSKGAAGIAVYPNPVINKQSALELKNLPAGIYEMGLYNSAGQLVSRSTINHGGGTASRPLPVELSLSKGIYRLQVTGPDKIKYNTTITIQ